MIRLRNYGCIALFLLPFISVGLAGFTYSGYIIIKSFIAYTWTPTKATTEVKGDAWYTYNYKGKRYNGNNIAFGYAPSNFDDEFTDRYHSAKTIMVYVNPKKPDESVAIPGFTYAALITLIGSIMWCSLLASFFAPGFLKKVEGENEIFTTTFKRKN